MEIVCITISLDALYRQQKYTEQAHNNFIFFTSMYNMYILFVCGADVAAVVVVAADKVQNVVGGNVDKCR